MFTFFPGDLSLEVGHLSANDSACMHAWRVEQVVTSGVSNGAGFCKCNGRFYCFGIGTCHEAWELFTCLIPGVLCRAIAERLLGGRMHRLRNVWDVH